MSQIKTRDLVVIGNYVSDAQQNRNNFLCRGGLAEGVSESSSDDMKGVIFKIRYNIDDYALDFDEFIETDKLLSVMNTTNIGSSFNDALEFIISNYIKESLEHQISIEEFIENLKEAYNVDDAWKYLYSW